MADIDTSLCVDHNAIAWAQPRSDERHIGVGGVTGIETLGKAVAQEDNCWSGDLSRNASDTARLSYLKTRTGTLEQ